MKKLFLALLGLAFAFVVSSCDEQNPKKGKERQKCMPKLKQQELRAHPRRW